MNKGKLLLETGFLILVVGLTAAALLKNGGPSVFIRSIDAVSMPYAVAAFGFLMAYILFESVIIKIIMSALDEKISLRRCAVYSFAGFFFYCISPAGSAEQPVQLYYMHKDGINASKAVFALAAVTFTFKSALLVMSGFTFLLMPEIITGNAQVFFLFTAGYILTALAVVAFSLMLFVPNTLEGAALTAAGCLSRIHILRNFSDTREKISRFIDSYRSTYRLCSHPVRLILIILAVTVVQRLCLMAITAVSCVALGADISDCPSLTLMQSIVGTATEMLPLPGGTGANEYVYITAMTPVLGDMTMPSLILSRSMSFYCQLIICGAVTGIIALYIRIRDRVCIHKEIKRGKQ